MHGKQGACSHGTHILVSEQNEEINEKEEKVVTDYLKRPGRKWHFMIESETGRG